MSYKSHFNSKAAAPNRKVSLNLGLAQAYDSTQQATSSKSHRSGWEKDGLSVETESSSRMVGHEGVQVLSITLYSAKYEVDCSDSASVERFLLELQETDAVKMETKLALSLMVAQRVQELRLNCEEFFNWALENYQGNQLHSIFN
jgi:hypothetical protein